jgi:hypothetical protein
MYRLLKRKCYSLVLALLALMPVSALASSHMDAPLITLDPAANTTDVYAFLVNQGRNGLKSLVVALGVYPHQEPGIGPNKYNFDDNVRYEIHVALGNDLPAGRATFTYRFQFNTKFRNVNTILQSYLGVIQNIGDANQNLIQTYTVTRIDNRTGHQRVLGTGIVPPNNQGNATPFYNQANNGENPARLGVSTATQLDRYTNQAISRLNDGYVSFAGQRDDGFFADIQSIFDLLKLRNPGKDSQGGFNLHLMALEIPIRDIGSDMQVAGVYATTSRRTFQIIRDDDDDDDDDDENKQRDDAAKSQGRFVQVARQGNPLFNEGLVAIADKDLYSRTRPTVDARLFRKYAENPELAKLLNLLVFEPDIPGIETRRTDIAGIFIPDLIKVDLSTVGVRFAGNGPNDPANPDDSGFSRLSIFGGDVLQSRIQDPFKNGGFIPGGWPNGRRFGDDVVDIAVTALISDLRDPKNLIIRGPASDGVDRNDLGFNKTFPYESTPQNGRVHSHP